MLLLIALSLAVGAALWALFDTALGSRLGAQSIHLAVFLCVGAATLAGMICAMVFYRQDRTPEWWIAGTHEATMKRVLTAAGVDSLETVSAKDLHDAQRSADVLFQLMPVAIVGPLIGAVGTLLLLATSVLAGEGFVSLACLALFLAQAFTAMSGVLTLGRAELVLTAVANGRLSSP